MARRAGEGTCASAALEGQRRRGGYIQGPRTRERKKEVEAIVVKREKDGESGGESGREMESVGEKTMAHGGAWLSTVAAVGINTGCRRHLRR